MLSNHPRSHNQHRPRLYWCYGCNSCKYWGMIRSTPHGKPVRDYGCIMMLTFATTMTTSSIVKQLPQFYTLLITSPIWLVWQVTTDSQYTATYRAEATADRNAIEQMRSIKLTLQYLWVRIQWPSPYYLVIMIIKRQWMYHPSHKQQNAQTSAYVIIPSCQRSTCATGEYLCLFCDWED